MPTAPPTIPPRPAQVWRLSLILGLGLGVGALGLIPFWAIVQVGSFALLVTLVLGHIAATTAGLLLLLRPVRAWEQAPSDPRLIREAADAGARAQIQLPWIGALNWVVIFVVQTGLAVAGVGSSPPGTSELVAIALLLVACVLGCFGIMAPVLRTQLAPLLVHIEREAQAAKLKFERVRVPLMSSLVRATVTLVGMASFGVGAMAVVLDGRSQREKAVLEAEHEVELAALRYDRGDTGDGSDRGVELELIDGGLPGLDWRGDPARAEPMIAFELETETAWAAWPGPEPGQWFVVRAPAEHRSVAIAGAVLLFTALLLGLVGAGGHMTASSLMTPLRRINGVLDRLATSGRVSEIERLIPAYNDEFGDLTRSFNTVIWALRRLVMALMRIAEGDLRIEVRQPGDLADAVRTMQTQLHDVVARSRELSLRLSTTATELHSSTQVQELAANEQSERVIGFSEALGRLAGSAEAIANATGDVLEETEAVTRANDAVAAAIASLEQAASGIAQLNAEIRDIADRSDLLALNGSLEATRAGEAGRGFSLVAAEMRRLAERVLDTAGDVSGQIRGIDGARAEAVAATEDSRVSSERTAEAAVEIVKAAERQQQDAADVSETVQAYAEVIVNSAQVTSQTRAAASELQREAEALEALLGRFSLRSAEQRAKAARAREPRPGEGARRG